MNQRSSSYGLVILSVLAFAASVGCASGRDGDTVSAASSPLGSKGGCGPVDFDGEAYDAEEKTAYLDAVADARRLCNETPMFCGVDCDGAPVTRSQCVASAVKGQDGDVGVTWQCSVTISASSERPSR